MGSRLGTTASRFDNTIGWLAPIGNEVALSVFDTSAPSRSTETTLWPACSELRHPKSAGHRWTLPVANRSTIVSVPLGDGDTAELLAALKERGVVCAARDGNLRLAVHFYNHEDDIEQVANALADL